LFFSTFSARALAAPVAPCCQRLSMTAPKRWPANSNQESGAGGAEGEGGVPGQISAWPSCGRLISLLSGRKSHWYWHLIADYMAGYNFIALGLSPKWAVTECEQFNKECGLIGNEPIASVSALFPFHFSGSDGNNSIRVGSVIFRVNSKRLCA